MSSRGEVRANGVGVLVGIVILGLGSGAAYYRYQQPRATAAFQERLDAAPTTLEGRVSEWQRQAAPAIHGTLTILARASSEQPWLVTHTVRGPEGVPEVWGIDVSTLGPEICRAEGAVVHVDLPAPRLLARGALEGEAARYVPAYDAGGPMPAPRDRLHYLASWFLEDLTRSIAEDIPGASLEIHVAE